MPAVAKAPPAPPPAISRPYRPFGAAREAMESRVPELILSGPAGTGKSRACLEKLYAIASKYPGSRLLIVRKTRESITETALVTWEEKVVPVGHPCLTHPIQRRNRQSYRFPNGSVMNVGGLDNPTRIMSTEYDVIFVQEAIELSEADWESLSSRLRNGVVPYQQLIGDTNPDAPQHWIKQRQAAGKLQLLDSRHEDNPVVWAVAKNAPTPAGEAYFARLDNLTGVRYLRLRKGLWVAAEGLIYDEFDPAVNLISRAELPAGWQKWPRFWAVDFGFTNPFVWQEWIQSPDGDLYLTREIYCTKTLVQDHAAAILAACGWQMILNADGFPTGRLKKLRDDADPLPEEIICDHDAEGRATLERYLSIKTRPANKTVKAGIEAVQARIRKQERGEGPPRPRLFICRDALIEVDPELLEARKPTCTADEIPGYVWGNNTKKSDDTKKEEPKKEADHGCDAMRYLVAFVDQIKRGAIRRVQAL